MSKEKAYLTAGDLLEVLGVNTVQGVYKILKSLDIETYTINSRSKVITPEGIRNLLIERGFKYPKKNLSFQIVKGGVGKTSLSYSLACRAAHYGARVLVIDVDQQSNLTTSFNVNSRNRPVLLNMVRDNTSIEDAIVSVNEMIDIIPSNLNNSRLDIELTQSASNLKDMIRDMLKSVRNNYDLVIIDCPPAINKINTAATCGSDTVIVPINPDPYAMDGLEFTLAELKKIRKEFKLKFKEKIVWNRYDAREKLGTIYLHQLAKNPDLISKILPVVIRVDTSLKNAVFDAVSIFEKAKKTGIREDIDQFTREVLGINNWVEELQNPPSVIRKGKKKQSKNVA
ncbi:cobalamin biosynthesis protein CobQ (plasmid) [Piscirickettsia salmonis]|uniref:ParA family protein n=3 Tax=Piscirickettsia salmonis TaxID=1238 RepID=A0A9Q5VFF0_PISSA|nr:AAA family ATPase [Piscirickettsia salmonis]RNC77222.1 cobalamin biosynthesis protein CobQ [Piscirickettsiaceae bacterium NZ-RLO2]ALA26563.1 cobQ/CobB/MinD/ParA nucleotide-binding domain protein [Piscirickettsia salmonis]APS45942.1 cobalamin biosynthesis protein CobQ [Piscirickettsia salmonis]APS49315.1 cobalamin biosynthesis protein CobQ [Piscirickettsia salmonis]APS52484.1 cobalamin biosynthesis protein CobQ [Piscirickettsia salmonis]